MLSRQAKAAFYALAGPAMRVNGMVWRRFRTPGTEGLIKVHLGPGQKNYLDGWVNVDANMFTGKCDIWADLRNPLPFADSSVDAAYSHHVIEHLPDTWAHFAEVYRVLKPGGIYRVGGPNGDSAIRKFQEVDHAWFSDFPDNRRSIGGRFVNLVFCRGEHLTLLTESLMTEVAADAGFQPGKLVRPAEETGHPQFFADCLALEHEPFPDCPRTLLMEFVK